MKHLLVGLLACIFSLSACNTDTSAPGKEVLAVVKGKYLYISDLKYALPEGLTRSDSIAFARSFVENWVTDQLMYEVARKNIPDEEKIDEMVEDYRRQLILSEYQRYLIEDKLSKEISDEEVEAYYNSHAGELSLNCNLIQGIYLKVPVNSPQHNQLRGWMALKKETDIEKIEKYSIQHAVAYEYFADKWKDLNSIMANIPYRISNAASFLRLNKTLEVRDSAYYYMLSIKKYAVEGSRYPEDYAREEIRNRLISHRKVDYLRNFKNDLLNRAIRKKEASVYNLTQNNPAKSQK